MYKLKLYLKIASIITAIAIVIIFFMLLFSGSAGGAFMILFLGAGLVCWYEVTSKGLLKCEKWAYTSAFIIFALFIPSVFFILGILGINELTKEDTKSMF
jgi:hypothetical protein